ncbi:MAG: sulfurtransferase TusA family protein [Desulfurivibrio sp.]|nr:sulfurtransferase TusA family protein [Desulfurivibrio sp.]
MADNEQIELDILGQVCPACLLVVLRTINEHRDLLKDGAASLVVKTDHRDTTRTVPESAAKMGYQTMVRKKGSYYEIIISSG